jgi:threonine synthase
MKKMERIKYNLVCVSCGLKIDEKKSHTLCYKCGSPLDALYDYKKIKGEVLSHIELHRGRPALHKYLKLLPISEFNDSISLLEGSTPLYHAEKLGKKFGLKNLYVKNEGANPTGVFKDRGSLVEILKALEQKAKVVIVASSGNMAASVAAYAARACFKCYILVPETTAVGKVAQMLEYGAHVIKIRGEYSDCVNLVREIAKIHKYFLAGDYVYRREGQKTLAYEIIEQFEYNPPDVVIVPTGAGTNISAIWKGFNEFKKLGLIKNLPKMVGVQARGASVIEEAFRKKLSKYKARRKTDTICSAVAVADPVDGNLVLKAVKESKGTMIAIEDKDALKAQKLLAGTEAIFCETSSALAIAAIPHLKEKKIIKKGDFIVCIATGNGLKDAVTAMHNMPVPPLFDVDLKTIDSHLRSE